MPFKPIYKYFYFNTPFINKFDEIKAFTIFELILFGFNRFNIIKKAIKKNPLNKYC